VRRYAILGTGAIGGYYGARLHQSGAEVHFLLRSDAGIAQQRGLVVDSTGRRIHVPPMRMHAAAADIPPCDVAIVALKSTQNAALANLLPEVLGPRSVVLVLQNGLGVDEAAAAVAGPDRVLGGLCFICANKIAPGHIVHLDYGRMMLGEYRDDGGAGGITPRLAEIAADFRVAEIDAVEVPDLLGARWRKLVWNVPYNGLSVAMRATTDRLMADPPARRIVEALMREVAAASAAYDRPIEEAFIRKMLDDTLRMQPYKTSMMLDFEARRPLEIDAIYGEPVRRAASRGVAMPLTDALRRVLAHLSS